VTGRRTIDIRGSEMGENPRAGFLRQKTHSKPYGAHCVAVKHWPKAGWLGPPPRSNATRANDHGPTRYESVYHEGHEEHEEAIQGTDWNWLDLCVLRVLLNARSSLVRLVDWKCQLWQLPVRHIAAVPHGRATNHEKWTGKFTLRSRKPLRTAKA
jgi:hypothetical protein